MPNPDYAPPPFADELRTEVEKALPWVVVGVLVTAGLEAVQLPFATLGGVLARAGPLGGAAVGLATPLCSCGALPVAAGLAASAPLRAVVAFLTASQSAGLDSAAITWGLLGRAAALWRLGGALLLAAAAGLAVGGGDGAAAAPAAAPAAVAPRRGRLAAAFKAAVGSARDAFPPVLLGLAGGAAALRWLPPLPQAHDDYADGLLPRVAVLAAALPLQLCEHSTVTAARAIRDAGGSPGLAFAFLLSAPATNLPSLLLLVAARRERARAAALRVAAAIAATALALSYAVDFAGADLFVERDDAVGAMATFPPWFVDACPWVAAWLAVAAVVDALQGRRAAALPPCCRPDKKCH